jgi:flagellar motor switch protein FliN
LARGAVSAGAAMVPLLLEGRDGKSSLAYLVWPAAKPSAVLGLGNGVPKPAAAKPAPAKPAAPSAVKPAEKPSPAPKPRPVRLEDLPEYTRSLLRIRVPVVVTLAEKRQPLGWVVELGPGSIIQFDKSCEEMLELQVGGQSIATGEAVKVGDKFGLRITSVVLPNERFEPVKGSGQ